MADQAASSITNFTLSFLVLRQAGIEDFGVFTIAYTTYSLALNGGRALFGEPLVIRLSSRSEEAQRSGAAAALGATVGVGTAAALVVAAVAWLVGGSLAKGLFPLALVLPGLLVQDAIRFGFFASRRPDKAFVNDAIWGAVQLALLLIILDSGRGTVGAMLLGWGIAGNLAALIGLLQARIRPNLRRARWWLSDTRDLGAKFLIETLTASGASLFAFYAIGAIAGLTALGSLNGVRVLLGPVNVMYLGMVPFVVAETVIIRVDQPERLGRIFRWLALAFAGTALAAGAVLLLLPDTTGRSLTANWLDLKPYMVPVTLGIAARAATLAYRAGLRTLEAPSASLSAQLLTSALTIGAGIIGAIINGGIGAAVGLTVASTAGAILWRGFFRRSLAQELDTHRQAIRAS